MQKILKIDYDRKGYAALQAFMFRYEMFKRNIPKLVETADLTETHKGYHIRIYLRRPVSDMECLFFQSILKSDWLRELRNYKRLKSKSGLFNILFVFKKRRGYVSRERKLSRKTLERAKRKVARGMKF